MNSAETRIVLQTPYAVINSQMADALEYIADNDSEFSILINSRETGDNLVASSDYTYNKNDILSTGADVYEYFGNHSSHAKSILIDDYISVIGSYNLDLRSTYLDTEIMLVIDCKEINEELSGYMESNISNSAKLDKNGEYVTNTDIVVNPSIFKRAIFCIIGAFLSPFRQVI